MNVFSGFKSERQRDDWVTWAVDNLEQLSDAERNKVMDIMIERTDELLRLTYTDDHFITPVERQMGFISPLDLV